MLKKKNNKSCAKGIGLKMISEFVRKQSCRFVLLRPHARCVFTTCSTTCCVCRRYVLQLFRDTLASLYHGRPMRSWYAAYAFADTTQLRRADRTEESSRSRGRVAGAWGPGTESTGMHFVRRYCRILKIRGNRVRNVRQVAGARRLRRRINKNK